MLNMTRFSNSSVYKKILDDLEDRLSSDNIDEEIGQLKPNHLPYLLVNGSIALAKKICNIQPAQIKKLDSLGMAAFKDERIEFLTPLLPVTAWKRLLFLRQTQTHLDLQQQILTALSNKISNSFILLECEKDVFTDLPFISDGFDYDSAMRNAIHYKNQDAIKTLAIHTSDHFCAQKMDDWYPDWVWGHIDDMSPNANGKVSAEHEECGAMMKAIREQHIIQSHVDDNKPSSGARKM